MEIFERNGMWIWREKPGVQHSFDTREAAHEAAGVPVKEEWKPWTPPELEEVKDLPLPEVREYDSMEEAIAEED